MSHHFPHHLLCSYTSTIRSTPYACTLLRFPFQILHYRYRAFYGLYGCNIYYLNIKQFYYHSFRIIIIINIIIIIIITIIIIIIIKAANNSWSSDNGLRKFAYVLPNRNLGRTFCPANSLYNIWLYPLQIKFYFLIRYSFESIFLYMSYQIFLLSYQSGALVGHISFQGKKIICSPASSS